MESLPQMPEANCLQMWSQLTSIDVQWNLVALKVPWKIKVPKMDSLQGRNPWKWMTWGSPSLWTSPQNIMEHHKHNRKGTIKKHVQDSRSLNAEKLPSNLVGIQPEKPGGQRRETPGSHCCICLRKKRTIHPSSQDGNQGKTKTGWWFQPNTLKKYEFVSSDHYSQLHEKIQCSKPPTR